MKYIYLVLSFVWLSVCGVMHAELKNREHKLGINAVKSKQNKVTVLGEGAWGTAIALALDDAGCDVVLWNYDATVAAQIKNTGFNQRYLPGVSIPSSIKITTDLQEALRGSDWIFETTPIQFLRAIATAAKPYVTSNQTWVALSKGIEENTLLLPTQIIADVLGKDCKLAVCAGPSFAKELAQKRITSIVIAQPNLTVDSVVPSLLASSYFRPYISSDMIGVQIGSALKNVLALGIGILDGAGYTDNAKAFLLSRGLQEMAHLAVAMGGKQETLYGLSGIGDLVLTCMGSSSKNLTVGRKLGEGQQLADIIRETGFIPEGINTVKSVNKLIQKYKINLPICQGIHDVIDGSITIHEMMNALMKQPLSSE